ncbi:MAG TPA: hypothetical protein PLG94_14540 [Smithellaceae bacterium]|jgi:hypothetical protein|nr:hypothetical protein [Smithellaceae bacterium]
MNIASIILEVCKDTHVPMCTEVFGDEGLDAVIKVMETVQTLYRHVDLERISGQVIIFKVANPANIGTMLPVGPAADFASLANEDLGDLCFQIAADGRPYTYILGTETPEVLAKTSVVYYYRDAYEEFLAGSQRKSVNRYDSSARSQFSVPTFSNVRDALKNYAYENVKESTCYIFNRVWYDDNRLFLIAGPESLMRDSLAQFLRNRLGGDHDVWPEQNVNEKNPVDIRVQPRFCNNRLMLIEIKWLGNSVNSIGHVTVKHRDSRAQDGADQLAGYLDEQRRYAPSRVIQGYYVIIDARRKRLSADTATMTAITRADGLHYECQSITFNPAHHLIRTDFDEPYRMFARPVCCD